MSEMGLVAAERGIEAERDLRPTLKMIFMVIVKSGDGSIQIRCGFGRYHTAGYQGSSILNTWDEEYRDFMGWR